MQHEQYETHRAEWQGIALEIRYCPSWSGSYEEIYGYPLAHLEIESANREPLPITETGYLSHFTGSELIAAEGGPVAYAVAWLDYEADSAAWKRLQAEREQLSLF
ncbi:MAG: hypothetical protein IH604_09030 [Burkholderiales bacterium]|nr:hypothetical protein [Burkholderiales bacterium]